MKKGNNKIFSHRLSQTNIFFKNFYPCLSVFVCVNLWLIIFFLLLPSCQTVEKRGIEKLESKIVKDESLEERILKERIREWEDHMNLIGYKELSLDTILKVTEGYFEAKEILYKKEVEEYEKALLDQEARSKKQEEEIKQPEQDYQSLIKYFRIIKDTYSYKKEGDAIYYALGYALYEQGERDEAIKVFEDLLTNFSKSAYLPEVNFRIGEFYFETGQMGEAMESYIRVLSFQKSVFYDKALYKLGWVYYKSDEFRKAADTFMSLIDRTWEGEIKGGGLLEETLSCLIMSLGHFDNMEQVAEYVQYKGLRRYTSLVLNKLGEAFVQQTRYEAAIYIYKSFIEIFPDNSDIPFIYEKIAILYEFIGDRESALNTKWVFVNQYNSTTAWYRKSYPHGSDKIDSLISKTIPYVSRIYHDSGKNESDLNKLKLAIKGYRLYLSLFPNSPECKEMNLLLAEALFTVKAYHEAGQEYERAARLYPEGSKRGEIAYSAILSYAVVFNEADEKRGETIKDAVRVLTAYRKDISLSGVLEKSLYMISDMYARTGAFNWARENLMPLTKGKESISAYKKIAEFYLAEDRLNEAEEIYSKLISQSKEPELRETLAMLRFRIGEGYLKMRRLNEAAEKFNQAFTVYPGSAVGEGALMKLGYIHIQTGNIKELKRVVESISKSYPNSTVGVSLLLEAGKKLEKGEPLKAAMLYEEASLLVTDLKDLQRFIFVAGILYEKNREYNKASDLFKRYLEYKLIPQDKEIEAQYRLGYSQLKLGRKKEGMETLNRLIELKGNINNQFITRTELLLLGERQNIYMDVKLTHPFEDTLKRKSELLNNLLKDYSSIAKLGISELLPEIFFSMGIALENFRDSILQSEKPAGLTKEEMEEYNFLLEEKAYPYDEQAVKVYESCMQISREYKIYNEWMQKNLDRLEALRPALYKREFTLKEVKPIFIYPEPAMIEVAGYEMQKYSKQ